MTDAYADPWRERGQWWGDAYVADHVNQVAFGDTQLLRRGLLLMNEAFEDGQPKALAPNGDGNHMLDYGMLWVQSVHEYWRRTGDVKLLTQIYPVATDFVEYLQQYKHPVTGLLDIPIDHWSKTVYLDTSVYYDRYGQSTAVNALYYDTLLDIADISEQLGDSSSASTLRQEASVVRTHVNKYLYIETEGRYAGSLLQDATLEPSPHAQAWALAYDLVPDDQIQRVADAMLELLSSNPAEPNVQIYGMFWTLEALSRAGRYDDAVRIINRYYGRLLDLGATTWWEHFNAYKIYQNSLSHGWGGSPTWFLTTYVLGAQRTGVNTWFVRPGLSGVESAEGALPLADGILAVRWNRPGCSQVELEVVAPRTTSGEVLIPLTDDSLMITLNEIPVWQDGMPLVDGVVAHQEGVLLSLSGEQHSFTIERACYPIYLPVVRR
jgi:alpha-L-rhamnosidase